MVAYEQRTVLQTGGRGQESVVFDVKTISFGFEKQFLCEEGGPMGGGSLLFALAWSDGVDGSGGIA